MPSSYPQIKRYRNESAKPLTADTIHDIVVRETSGALFLAKDIDEFLRLVLPVDEQLITSIYESLIEDKHLHGPLSQYTHTLAIK
jgi:hypothetical protein